MKLLCLPLLFVASSSLCQVAGPATSAAPFTQALKSASAPLAFTSAGDLADTGGELVREAVQRAQFVLLGESHFSRETPAFAAAVCRAMHPDSYAVEAGPFAAAFVSGLLKHADRKRAMQQRELAYPASMAFLNDEQENDLAANCASAGSGKFALWGLDQEFEGAAPVLLAEMAAQPNGAASAAAIRSARNKDKQAEARALSSGDFSQLFLVSSSDADIAALQAAVDQDGTPTSKSLLHEFVVSRRIYRLHLAGSQESNAERASLLKQNFLVHYRALQQGVPAPKVLIKFGDNHVWKGFNDTHQLDLGDFVAELASVEHTSSLHIQVLAAKGSLAILGGYGKPPKKDPFVLADIPEYAWLKPVVGLLPADDGTGTKGVVIDLRKLRFQNTAMPTEWQRLVYGYDLLVMLPRFTPASFY